MEHNYELFNHTCFNLYTNDLNSYFTWYSKLCWSWIEIQTAVLQN